MAELARHHHNEIQKDGPEIKPEMVRAADIDTALSNITARLSDNEAESVGANIERDECELALRFSKSGSAPGLDGIPYEVWKTLNERYKEDRRHNGRESMDIMMLLHSAFRDVQEYGVCAAAPFAEGWMAPIYKEKGERTKIANYRPITLLNTDYKLLTKILSIRLASVAPGIIHESQAGFVPGRRLRNHTQLAKLIMNWAEAREVNGAIIALDQEKAYDKVAHDYLWKVLEKFGIPERFIATVKTLYARAETRVMINRVSSNTYQVYRGVRQGDPLSCLLFDLAIEPLSAMIRNSPLKGIKILRTAEALKAILFADDTTVYLAEEDDFGVLQEILDTWCSAAKARFNISKTEIIPIGAKAHRERMIEEYNSPEGWNNYPVDVRIAHDGTPVRILGAFLGNGIDECPVWSLTITKLAARIEAFQTGHSTIEGKRHAVQMTAGGTTQFLTDVQRMPKETLQRINKMVQNYMWDDSHNTPVAMNTLFTLLETGGLALLDLESRNDAMDIMWLKTYLDMSESRPLWAYVVDDLFRHAVPTNIHPKEPELRINPFLQHWEPSRRTLPKEAKALLDIAKKYNVRPEGLAFERSILREAPMWDHFAADRTEIRKLAGATSTTDCLKHKHQARSVGDFEELVGYSNAPTHSEPEKSTLR